MGMQWPPVIRPRRLGESPRHCCNLLQWWPTSQWWTSSSFLSSSLSLPLHLCLPCCLCRPCPHRRILPPPISPWWNVRISWGALPWLSPYRGFPPPSKMAGGGRRCEASSPAAYLALRGFWRWRGGLLQLSLEGLCCHPWWRRCWRQSKQHKVIRVILLGQMLQQIPRGICDQRTRAPTSVLLRLTWRSWLVWQY